MIKVAACVIHEVLKEAKNDKGNNRSNEAKLDLSNDLLNIEDKFVVRLLETIHSSFSEQTSIKNTHFEPNSSTKFSTMLEEYLGSGDTNDFLNFSIDSIKALKILIEKENFATGGYYIYSDYTYDSRRYLSVMVVRKNKEALNLKKIAGKHQPGPAENLNTEKIAMGFRLNHNIYNSTEADRNYIALLTKQQDKELSGYFKDWVNAAGIISHDKNSLTFVNLIKQIDLPLDNNGETIYTREEFQKAAHQFAERAPGKIINVNTFSAFAYGEENSDYVMKYAANKLITLDPEFKRTTSIFKKLVTIRAWVPGIELNVDYNKLNQNEVDIQGDTIIIKSAELAQQIKDQQ